MAVVLPMSSSSRDEEGKTKPLLHDLTNFWKIHQTQRIVGGIAIVLMGIIYYVGHRYEVSKLYDFTFPMNPNICPNKVRAGDPEDGGWWLCGEQTAASTAGGCVVYSFGIRDNFSFDHYLAKEKGCEVHGFDPSPYGLPSKPEYEKIPNAHYHSSGLGYRDKKYGIDQVPFRWPGLSYLGEGNTAEWQLYRLPTTRQQLNHQQKALTILKIDIEGGEWDVMEDIIQTEWDELYMELHFPPAQYHISRQQHGGDLYIKRTPYATVPPDAEDAVRNNPKSRNSPGKIDRIHLLQKLSLVADLFYWENNNICQRSFAAECIEIYFKRKKNTSSTTFAPPPNKFHLVD